MIGEVERWHEFLITELGLEDVVLGLPWLRSVNPEIDWARGKMKIELGKEGEELKEETGVQWVVANRQQQWRWWRSEILEDPSGTLWCMAGYTYSG